MAGGKETPRQKMIGMMYLVLMTLLALNVSKEIVNAFVTQDEQLLTTNNNLVRGVNGLISKFSLLELDLATKKKYAKWKPKIDSITKLANELDDYIMDKNNLLLLESEQKANWFTKDSKTQITKWTGLDSIKNKDNYDIATRLFGGESTSQGYKKGAEIRAKLLELRNNLILTVGNYTERGKPLIIKEKHLIDKQTLKEHLKTINHPEKEKLLSIYETLNEPEKLNIKNDKKAWQFVKFDHQPVVGAIGVFTGIRNQIRMSEQKALDLVFGKMDGVPMKINKIEPQIIANTHYLNVGDTVGVRVGIIAYDSTATYPIKYELKGETFTKANNQFTVRGSGTGNQSIKGSLTLELADGKKDLPWEFNYTVGKPQGSISLPEYNVIYSNYDNVIEGTASGFPPDQVSVKCSGCNSFTKSGDKYIAKANRGREVTISVKAPGLNYSKKYKVLGLPKPELMYMGKTDGTISASQAKRGTMLTMLSPDSSPLKVKYKITSFKVDIYGGSRPYFGRTNSSRLLSTNDKRTMQGVARGTTIVFSDIKYKTEGSNRSVPLGKSLSLKVR